MTAAINPTKTPDEIVEDIEAAEEAKDVDRVVAFLGLASSNEHSGEEDWAEAAEAALDALYRLVKGGAVSGSDDESLLFHLQAVFDALNAWEEVEAIVEVGLGCLVAIASKADTKDEDDVAIPVEFVLDLMKDFSGEQTIQEQSCLAIEGLARITNERNKAYPVRAAKALGIDFE
jgi:hypothetical protein